MIFLLTTFGSVEQHVAQGTNLVFFIPTCIISIIINLKNKNIQRKTAKTISLAGIIGAIIGSVISINMNINLLKKFFGYFLLLIAIFEFYSLIRLYIKDRKANNKNS